MLFRISVQEQSTWVEWKLQISKFKGKRKSGFVHNLQRPCSLNEFFGKLLKIRVFLQSLKVQVGFGG